MIELRPYQQAVIADFTKATENNRRVLMFAPTRSEKTVMPREPSREVLSWVRSRTVAWAKSQRRAS